MGLGDKNWGFEVLRSRWFLIFRTDGILKMPLAFFKIAVSFSRSRWNFLRSRHFSFSRRLFNFLSSPFKDQLFIKPSKKSTHTPLLYKITLQPLCNYIYLTLYKRLQSFYRGWGGEWFWKGVKIKKQVGVCDGMCIKLRFGWSGLKCENPWIWGIWRLIYGIGWVWWLLGGGGVVWLNRWDW